MSYVDFIIPGYDWHSPQFQIKTDGAATDISGWTLTADFFWRGLNSSARIDPSQVILTLTSGSSYFSIANAASGLFEFDLVSSQTVNFDQSPTRIPGPSQKVTARITRTDGGRKDFIADVTIEVRF